MVDVFLSYSRKDKEPVARLARAIEDEGYDVWWDAELPPHQSYGDVITSKITEAKAAIVVWSDDAAASEWVRAEADMARNQRKLVQTALGDIMPPLPFNQIQYADIGDWKGEDDHPSWRKVKASLADLCGRNGPDASVASAHEPAYAPVAAEPAAAAAAEVYEEYDEPAAPSKWPLFAGLGIAGIAAVGAAAFLFMPDGEPEDDALASADIAVDGAETGGDEGDMASTDEGTAPPPATRPDIPENWILATVEDADGNSNVRARPFTSSAIVSTVQVGETFRTRREAGKWWPVELADGTKGFIAKRLIRVTGTGGATPAPAPAPAAKRVNCTFNNTAVSYDGGCDFTAGSDGDFSTTSVGSPYFMNVTQIDLDVTAPGQGTLKIYYPNSPVQQTAVTRSTADLSCWEAPNLSFCAK
ncbi:MAG: TIR domain-containing protein [Erythrobacter sp.]